MVVTVGNVSWSVCREVFVVNGFYACFYLVVTVVTLSKVNFVPRDRTSSDLYVDRRDRTRAYLDDTVVIVVNCCQRVATRPFFMLQFGGEHYSVDSSTTCSRQLRPYGHRVETYRDVTSVVSSEYSPKKQDSPHAGFGGPGSVVLLVSIRRTICFKNSDNIYHLSTKKKERNNRTGSRKLWVTDFSFLIIQYNLTLYQVINCKHIFV
jgi:hypothetical protein